MSEPIVVNANCGKKNWRIEKLGEKVYIDFLLDERYLEIFQLEPNFSRLVN